MKMAISKKKYILDLNKIKSQFNKKDFPCKKNEKQEQGDISRLKIKIVYDKMVGGFTVKRKKFETVTIFENPDVRKSDNVIIGAGGRRISSNNTSVRFFYKKKYARRFVEISRKELINLGYKVEFYK